MSGLDLPKILKADVSLILPQVLPDLLTGTDKLKPESRFLSSTAGYARYYREHECPCHDKAGPVKIPAICSSLSPLLRRHTMHSYWKSFRRSVELALANGKNVDELFCLLPLQVSIPLDTMTVYGHKFGAGAYVHVFPFGGSVVNLDVNVSNITFPELIAFIANLKRANIFSKDGLSEKDQYINRGAFKNFATGISGDINAALFEGAGVPENFSAHTLIFIKKAEPELSDAAMNHRIAIAAALDGRSYEEESGLDRKVIDKTLQNQMNNYRLQELLFFTPQTSLFVASPDWKVAVPDNLGNREAALREEKLDKKMSCMKSNYQSCLNVLFAVNRVLCNVAVREKRIPPARLEEFRKSIGTAFPDDPARIYFKHLYEKVAPAINLKENMNVLRQ